MLANVGEGGLLCTSIPLIHSTLKTLKQCVVRILLFKFYLTLELALKIQHENSQGHLR